MYIYIYIYTYRPLEYVPILPKEITPWVKQSFIPLSRVMRSLSPEGGSPPVGMTQSVPGTSLAGMTAGVSDRLCSYTESLTGSLEF